MPYGEWEYRTPFATTNRGLSITLGLTHFENDIYVAALDCPVPPAYEGHIGICLKRLSTASHQYARVYPHRLVLIDVRGNLQMIYVRQHVHNIVSDSDTASLCNLQLRRGPSRMQGYTLRRTRVEPSSLVSSLEVSSKAPQWILSGTAFVFKVAKGGGRFAAAHVFKHED